MEENKENKLDALVNERLSTCTIWHVWNKRTYWWCRAPITSHLAIHIFHIDNRLRKYFCQAVVVVVVVWDSFDTPHIRTWVKWDEPFLQTICKKMPKSPLPRTKSKVHVYISVDILTICTKSAYTSIAKTCDHKPNTNWVCKQMNRFCG